MQSRNTSEKSLERNGPRHVEESRALSALRIHALRSAIGRIVCAQYFALHSNRDLLGVIRSIGLCFVAQLNGVVGLRLGLYGQTAQFDKL